MTSEEQRWTVQEIADLSRRFLSEEGSSKRVRWEPTPRLIRYYTTLGLVDRPFGVRGHTVYYGPRHLLQLLAIKALQLAGEPLSAIQERLQGLPDSMLQRLAGLPEEWLQNVEDEEDRQEFWLERPQYDTVDQSDSEFQLPIQGLTLAPGVTLLLDRKRYKQIDLNRLVAATTALRAVLEEWEEP